MTFAFGKMEKGINACEPSRDLCRGFPQLHSKSATWILLHVSAAAVG
jgi:hypothetical protein